MASKEMDTLVLTLLPRAVLKEVAVERVKDYYFLLPLVDINRYETKYELAIEILEEYVEF